MKGSVEHIHIAGQIEGPMRSVDSVEATAGVGLAGDRYAVAGQGADVTLIEAEAIESAMREHDDLQLAPGELRRNLTTRGVRLSELLGKEFWIGGVLARGVAMSEPCEHLQRVVGKPVLKPLVHRGGLRADLLSGGRIDVGDPIELKD